MQKAGPRAASMWSRQLGLAHDHNRVHYALLLRDARSVLKLVLLLINGQRQGKAR